MVLAPDRVFDIPPPQVREEDDARWSAPGLAGELTDQALNAAAPGVRSVANTTSVGSGLVFSDQDINGLLSGVAWNATNLTYSFPTSASNYGAGYADQNALGGWQVLMASQMAVFRYALGLVAEYTGLTFTEITETDTTHATLRFSGSSYPPTSYAYYPSTAETGGDIWLGNIRNTEPLKAGYEFDTIMHELGHALGLKHGHTTDGTHGALPAHHDSTEWSLMSYHSYVGGDEFYRNRSGSGNQTYMIDDIAAFQYIYGANFTTRATNTTYSWSTTTGEMTINGVGQGPAVTNTIYEAIWDGGGKDTYDLSNYSTGLNINLGPGEWSTFSASQLPYLSGSSTTIRSPGNIANAHLYNQDARSYIENAIGGSGNDSITGNAVANNLVGGKGNDTLVGLDGDDGLSGGKGNDQLVGGIGNDTLRGNVGDDRISGGAGADLMAGGDGNDTVVYDDATASVVVSLSLLGAQNTGGGGLDTLELFENIDGSGFADTLSGDTSANRLSGGEGNDILNGDQGDDVLLGGGGLDTLVGGQGRDTLTGGLQADIFAFRTTGGSSPGAPRDVVTDFNHSEGDRIDLSGIDANKRLAGQQSFVLGGSGFTGVAAELIQFNDGAGHTIVAGDINGDRVADIEIQLNGLVSLVAGDFILAPAAPAPPIPAGWDVLNPYMAIEASGTSLGHGTFLY
jgi:serralysin